MPYLIGLGPADADPIDWPDVVDAYPVTRATAQRLRGAALADAWAEGLDGWRAEIIRVPWWRWAWLHVDYRRRFGHRPQAARVLDERTLGEG